ncbi:MAG: hypothetical protein AAFY29_06545 [Pseudomonadota bacterium]
MWTDINPLLYSTVVTEEMTLALGTATVKENDGYEVFGNSNRLRDRFLRSRSNVSCVESNLATLVGRPY